MSMADRAAQFSPFAALTGYEDAVAETARLTEERKELSDDAKNMLDRQLQILIENAHEMPEVFVTYFNPDAKKSGGSYETISGRVRWVNEYEGMVIFANDLKISLKNICDINGEIFRLLDNLVD